IIQRRLQRGIISPLDLINEKISTNSEVESTGFVIICHTEKGLADFENPKSFAYVLLQKLKSIYGNNTLYLQGGFESFSNNFPHLCTSSQGTCANSPQTKLRAESLFQNKNIQIC
ncbi:hypothetical protein, partial [Salmonella sp. s51228]|uniref:hypothetical protein n=1 Tax=Salmonella sp. s51228 TaxID=3159652 RepID=UPI00397F6F11